jgi:uncharacterized protein
MSLVYWDTMLFIYFLEGHPEFGPRVRQIHREMVRRGDRLCTSTFTLGEVLAGPEKKKAADVVKAIKDYFRSDEIELIPFRTETAELYGRIRADNPVLPADAIHLASAAEARSDLFLTNDQRLQRLNVSGIKFIAGLDGTIF